MHGPEILVRTLARPNVKASNGAFWQYHSRSDHHSKVACWAILFDLMLVCPLLRRQVAEGTVAFGINHEMRDFHLDRKKNLDLVLCTPSGAPRPHRPRSLVSMQEDYGIDLSAEERSELGRLPNLRQAPVGAVLMALEAKACMTAHQRALPRLYDELNSSHLTVHGANDEAIAAGFIMVNASPRYLSPDLNRLAGADPVWSTHNQPRDAMLAIEKARLLPRRSRTGETGYDAMAIVVVDMPNDGGPVSLVEKPPAPAPGDNYYYPAMIDRLRQLYTTRFQNL
jgi:hypothetical protein